MTAGTLKVTGSIATSTGVTVNGGTFEAGASQSITQVTLNGGQVKVTGGTPFAPTVVKVGNNSKHAGGVQRRHV